MPKYLGHLADTFRLRGPLAEDATARMLNVLLCALTAWWGTWAVVLLPFHWSDLFWSMPNQIVTLAALVAALTFLRRGRFRAAIISYLAGIWFFATHVMALNGGIRSTAQVLYVTLPISAAWLLGYEAACWISGACMFCTLALALLELAGVCLPRKIPGTPLGAWAVFGMACLIGAVPVAQILRDLRLALSESRRSEEDSQRTALRLQTEIEEHKRTLQALGESEERFRITADTAPVMILAQNANQNATFFNKVWLDFTGRSLEYELGKGWTEGVHPDDLNGYRAGLSAAYAEQKEYRLQFRLRRKDGEFRLIMCRGVPRFKLDRTFDGFIASAIDITDLKRSQEELAARQKLESLGVLASGIAHDFNNLLGGVLAQAELGLLQLGAGSNPEHELMAIRDGSLRGSEIVRQLMIYAGKETSNLEPVDISQIVREMLELLKVSISKHAVLEADLEKDLAPVRANAAQVRQIVMNLVTNASEAIGDRAGVIRMITRNRTQMGEGSAISGKVPASDSIILEVSDSGCGMSPETQAKVFDPFFTTRPEGHGLGLAVVNGNVRSIGGSIHVTSEKGKGTTFQIILPCAAGTIATNDAAPDIEQLTRPSKDTTVLVVEDETSLRKAVTTMLQKMRFEVFETADGNSAIEFLRMNGSSIDAILLDMTIPGAASAEVVAEAVKVRPEIRVILTSAYSQETLTGAMCAPQVRSFIRKPFHIRDLVKALNSILSS